MGLNLAQLIRWASWKVLRLRWALVWAFRFGCR